MKNWSKNIGVGTLVFLAMAIPSAFYSNTAALLLKGKINLIQITAWFPVSFLYYFFMSALPEELIYRGFIQTRLSAILKSDIGAVLLTSLLFGLGHIPGIMQWYPGITFAQAFCRAFFVQTLTGGLIYGILLARTGSLISCIFLHAAIDGLNNLEYIIALMQG